MYEFDTARFEILEKVYKDYKTDALDTQFRVIRQLTEELNNCSKRSKKYLSIKEYRDYIYKLTVMHIEILKEESVQYFTVKDIRDTYNKLMSEIERIDNLK